MLQHLSLPAFSIAAASRSLATIGSGECRLLRLPLAFAVFSFAAGEAAAGGTVPAVIFRAFPGPASRVNQG